MDKAEPIDSRPWRGLDKAPQGERVQLLVLGSVDWIYATFDGEEWLDANGTPVIGLAWRPADVE